MGICNGNFGHVSTKSAPLVPASFAAETRSFFPIFRAQENIPPTCARNPLILRALAGIIPRQVHTEWYRSGYNGPDSKSGVPATVPWVRIPPTPPAKEPILPDGLFCCFLLWVGFERRLLAVCRWHAATAVAFPQKRNPTHTTRLQDSLDHPAGEFLIMGGGRSLYCEAVNPTHSASEHRCAHILPFRKRSSQR